MVNFNVKGNIILSELNRKDLKDFLRVLDSFYLEYRDNLGLPKDAYFGIEIEYLGPNPKFVDFYVDETMKDWHSNIDWDSKREMNIPAGGEVTSPIMFDFPKYWQDIKSICGFLKNNEALKNLSFGGHIHAFVGILGDDYEAWRKFFKLYTIFENVLYRFGYGDKINGRPTIMSYAEPVGDLLIVDMNRFNASKEVKDIKTLFPMDSRNYGLNLLNVNFDNLEQFIKNTIEFRFLNATIEEVIWQNNINALIKLLLAAKNPNLNESYLDSLLEEMENLLYNPDIDFLRRYDTITFRHALLFVDLIFDNTLDKMYFLKQYFKNFQHPEEKGLVLAKRFIK